MKTGIKNAIKNHSLTLKTFLTLEFEFRSQMFRLFFLSFWVLALLDGAETSAEQLKQSQAGKTDSVNSGVQIGRKLLQSEFSVDPNSSVRRQLWWSNITIPKSEENEDKDELKRIIGQLRSVKFKQQQTTEPSSTVEPRTSQTDTAAEPNDLLPVQEATKEPDEKRTDFELSYNPVSEQTLQMLRNSLQHPDRMHNFVELAEILLLSGNLKEAAAVYRQFLDCEDPNKTISAQDRGWTLLQIGNCLRNDDPAAAIKIYEQLVTEYPDSLWANLAKTRIELIKWYQEDKPKTLINLNFAETLKD